MLRVREDEDNPGQVIIAGQTQTKTEKRFECPECHRTISYYGVSPLKCQFCTMSLPDVTRMTGIHGENDRLYFHRTVRKVDFE